MQSDRWIMFCLREQKTERACPLLFRLRKKVVKRPFFDGF